MGKKKAVKKIKELSVAIAESSVDIEGQQQPLTPRKRGRPRKIIVEKIEVEEVKEKEETAQEDEGHDVEGGNSKKVETSEEKEEGQPSEMKEEVTTTSLSLLSSKKQLPTPRSRARRKSKPRKSS